MSNVTDMSWMFYEATTFNQNLTGWCVTEISTLPKEFSTNSAFEAGNHPVWGTCPDGIVSNEFSPESLPTSFSLQQNYPNPFNPSTVITYSLPEASNVTLKVFDMLGREVSSLVSEHKAAGTYTISFNASHLSSGTYIYQIKAGTYVETKKLQLIK